MNKCTLHFCRGVGSPLDLAFLPSYAQSRIATCGNRTKAEEARSRAEEAALSLQKLELPEQQIQELKNPWWKKWFSVPKDQSVCEAYKLLDAMSLCLSNPNSIEGVAKW